MATISLEGVSKFFDGGDTIANYNVDLTVKDGEFLVLLGPSGCGKTTALRLVAGLEKPSEGEIYFDDERVDEKGPAERNVAMVFQNYALYPHMTVRGNIEYPLKVRGVPPDERDERIAEVTELLHIEDLLEDSPSELSGGQRQRTALARAIVRKPTVFLLDEPLSNLDAKLRLEMRAELKRIQEELDITTVYVTHNQEEAMSMGDRIAVMNDGTVRQVGGTNELYDRPRTEWVADFIGSPSMNIIDGVANDGVIELASGDAVQLPRDVTAEEVSLGVRPENLDVDTNGAASENLVTGTVDTVEPLGEYTIVNVDVGREVVKAKVPTTDVSRGDEVSLTFEDENAYLYDEEGKLLAGP